MVKNAQGDPNIERSIMQQFNGPSVDIVAPIGTDASQMAIAMIQNKPIIGIAADQLKQNAKKANNPNVTGVLDEVSVAKQIAFIHQAMPQIKKLTLVYSSDDRIFADVKTAVTTAKKYNIKIQKLMMSQLSDLYTISHNIDKDSQGIFILKDELIVSGINTLLQQAEQKKLPLIASDDGSVGKGAAFALGVSETQIGVDAANMALKIINGQKAADLPVFIMKDYSVFLNPAGAAAQNVNVSAISAAAKKAGYVVTTL